MCCMLKVVHEDIEDIEVMNWEFWGAESLNLVADLAAWLTGQTSS